LNDFANASAVRYNVAVVTLNAHFDGTTIVLDEPMSLPLRAGARLRLNIETVDEPLSPASASSGFQPLKIGIETHLSNAIALDPEFGVEEP
jgi:hypothetical protein